MDIHGRKKMTEFNIGNKGVGFSRRRLLQLGGGRRRRDLDTRALGQVGWAYADDKPPIGTWPAGSQGYIGHDRRRGAAHRRLCRAGRGRTQGHAACRRAHQRGPRPDQEDRAQGDQGRARQAGEAGRRRLGRQAEQCGAGAADLHQREQDHRDDRLDLVGGRGGAQQVRPAREGALPGGDLRLQRHHRQGLRALPLPPVLLWRDRGQRDRPGAGQELTARTRRRRS